MSISTNLKIRLENILLKDNFTKLLLLYILFAEFFIYQSRYWFSIS